MTHGRRLRIAAYLLIAVPGCAQSGGFLAGRPTVGTLKTSVSHLEFENQQLKKQVATLKSENRDIENRLVQEEAANGELSARLDDARTMLGQRGSIGATTEPEHNAASPVARPAADSSRKRRKPPFAQIPGRIDDINDEPPASTPWNRRSRPSPNSADDQSRNDEPQLWLPVARAPSRPVSTR